MVANFFRGVTEAEYMVANANMDVTERRYTVANVFKIVTEGSGDTRWPTSSET
jgi:hypothetical protein